MDRGLNSVHFDRTAWFEQFSSPANSVGHARAAIRLLLATAPQNSLDLQEEPLGLVRSIVLDAAYQLK